MFLSSEIPTPPLPPSMSQWNSLSPILLLSGTPDTKVSTTNVALFWSNPKEEESPLALSRSIAPVDSHPSSSKEVAQSQSRPLRFSSLLAPTQGGSEFRIVHRGLGYFGVNCEEGGVQKKKTQVGELRQRRQNHLGLKEKSAHHAIN